ncbi:hypothetical protein [Singulisphaera sp. PoT]|uniref:hypothetical protein n=1 Tax=Singulisphaera sp. PoT TaxID=3411797 RepID=UPI003BF57C43
MTRIDIISLGQAHHGTVHWIGPFAKELGYSFSQLSRVVNGLYPVSRRMQLEAERLKRLPGNEARRSK